MRQVETPGKSTIFVSRQIYLLVRHDSLVAWRLHYSMTVKLVDLGDSRSWESPEKADNVWRLFIQILLHQIPNFSPGMWEGISVKRLTPKRYLKAFQMPPGAIKHQLTCPFELTSGCFLIGRRRILVIPRNHLVLHKTLLV